MPLTPASLVAIDRRGFTYDVTPPGWSPSEKAIGAIGLALLVKLRIPVEEFGVNRERVTVTFHRASPKYARLAQAAVAEACR